jgi:hypothetical protein
LAYGGVNLIVVVPKKQNIKDVVVKGFNEMGYKLVAETDVSYVFEGVFSLRIPSAALGIGHREFVNLCKEIAVDGGLKKRRNGVLFINPERKKRLVVRLSEDEYETLSKVAENRRLRPHTLFRETLMLALSERRGV